MVQRYDASVNSAKLLVRPQTRPAPVDGFYQPTSSGRGQPIDVPAANSSGPSYPYPSYDPTRPVASASFHSAAGPLVPGHDRNRGRSNGSHYGRNGFSGSGSGHYALADDYGLSGEDMTSARFRQSGGRLEDRVGQYRSDFQRTHPQAGRPSLGSQAGSQGFAPAKDPANSPSQQQRRDQIKRKEESERVSFAERDAQSRELQRDQLLKRKEAREKGARESQSKPGGGAGASTAASARSAFKAPRRKPLADASGSANPKAGQVKVRPTDKGKGKVVHGAGSDGSAGEQENRPKRKEKGKKRLRQSVISFGRRDGFADDGSAGPSSRGSKSRARDAPSVEPVAGLAALFQEAQQREEEENATTSAESEDDSDGDSFASLDERFESPEKIFGATQAPVDPDTLCPFCDGLLPDEPSRDLIRNQRMLLNHASAQRKSTLKNPGAVRFRENHVMHTAAFCKQHENERVHIPLGRTRGWPTTVDWTALVGRIKKTQGQHLSDIVMGKAQSPFLKNARSDWERVGGRRGNAIDDFATFNVEEPGYYGPEGRRIMYNAIKETLTEIYPVLYAHRTAPLDVDFYIRRVLVPECALELIRDDLSEHAETSREEALEVLEESRGYGKAMFPDTGGEDVRASTVQPVEIPVTSSARGASNGKKRSADRASSPLAADAKRRRKQRATSASSRSSDSSDSEVEVHVGSSQKATAPIAVSNGGLRKPKALALASSGNGKRPPSSFESNPAGPSSRLSKGSSSTAPTTIDSDISDEGPLRPPPSAQASSKPTCSSRREPAAPSSASGSIFAGMGRTFEISDTASGSESESEDDFPDEIETGGVARNPKKDRARARAAKARGGGEEAKKAKKQKKKKKMKSPEQVDKARKGKSPKKRRP